MQIDDALLRRIAAARAIAVLTGAGISAESGLGTFRGAGGLWNSVRVEDYATPEAFARRPEAVWSWYAERWRAMRAAEPNPGHRAIVRLQELFPSSLVMTQNIDGLHQRAGSKDVLELHGGLRRARCTGCDRRIEMDDAIDPTGALVHREPMGASPPACECGGTFRPDVVWFGEMLPEGAIEHAAAAAETCGVFLTVGTSGTVMPAASLIAIAAAAEAVVVEVNPEPSAMSGFADVALEEKASIALPWLIEKLEAWRKRSAG